MVALLAAFALLRPSVPPIGRVFGLRLGWDSMEQLERRLGKGFQFMGGHPRGGRSWVDAKRKWLVASDGFEYGYNGRLIEAVWFEPLPREPLTVPHVKGSLDYGFLDRFRFGFSRAQVKAAMKGLQGAWKADSFFQSGKAKITPYPGKVILTTRWTAKFTYDAKGLQQITLTADYEVHP